MVINFTLILFIADGDRLVRCVSRVGIRVGGHRGN